VVFKLTKRYHKINTSYGDITNELAKTTLQLSLKDVSNAACHSTKQIPDPKELETGSFFLKSNTFKKLISKNTSAIS
jgi:UDP-N-acetylmuramate dehydrogenase